MTDQGPNRPRALPISLKVVWTLAFAAVVAGVALAFRFGPRVVPFLDASR